MREAVSTQLRYVRSKKLDTIMLYVNSLPYKIEIKGGVIHDGKKYILSFVLLPEIISKEIPSGEID